MTSTIQYEMSLKLSMSRKRNILTLGSYLFAVCELKKTGCTYNYVPIFLRFPLQQARQAYTSMDVDLRHSLLTALEAATTKHKLPNPTKATFQLHRLHSPVIAALDVVYAIMALIENVIIVFLAYFCYIFVILSLFFSFRLNTMCIER